VAAPADGDLAFAGLAELAPRLRSGELSPVELTEAVLGRIERHNGRLNAYLTVTAEAAREDARAAEAAIRAGRWLGPLHGVPVAVKDSFLTKGVRTAFGSPLYADFVPDHDAAVVERLRGAGAVVLGKTNVHEITLGTTSANPHFGPVRNPWNTEYHPGGSSGGSAAAVAAGLAVAALGSDTGGSIRQPAACCGLAGIKPTFGLVSKFGALPLSWSMDHAGPICRTVADAALMLQVLAGPDPRDPSSADPGPVPDYAAGLLEGEGGDLRGRRIGVARVYFEDCDPEVVAAVEAAVGVLRGFGAEVVDDGLDLPDMEAVRAAATVILFSEAHACHAADLRRRPEAYSEGVRAPLVLGGFYTARHYLLAQRLRRHLAAETARAMAGLDAVVMPTSPVPATPIDRDPPGHTVLRGRNCIPFNLLGLPALSVPCGFTAAGLPIGLQIVGKAFDEPTVLTLGHAYERATPWHERRPPEPAAPPSGRGG
jgi:aspartyl-tRNA(Asn)/glutamyl-tRNA(Gln) amidotransferase subunit A